MITKKVRKSNKSKYKYQSYEDLEKLGLGSWLKENAGTIGGIAGIGASFIPGVGPAIGMGLASAGQAVSNNATQNKALDQQNQQTAQTNAYNQAQGQLQTLQANNPQQNMGVVARCGGRLKRKALGGTLNYDGQTHEGPDGGVDRKSVV